MDQRAWIWRKKSSEKTIVATDKFDVTFKRNDGQVQTFLTGKAVGPDRSVKNLNEKLASVLFDCHPKDDLGREQAELVQEANAGQEKPEAESALEKKGLDEALGLQLASNDKVTPSDAPLMKCTRRLDFDRQEEKRKHDAETKTPSEFEKAQKELEKNLREANERLAKLAAENSYLSKSVLVKEKLIEDLSKHKSQAEAEFSTLMSRLDATEKENAFLKYEFHILEKELEIRNEEMEYTRRSVEAAQKQHLESVKKITKLEAECQRLRPLGRKKQPGSAASAMMKSEVEMLGRDQMDMRRRKLNPSRDLILREATMESSPEVSSKNISLIEQLHDMEEENKTLKDILTMKSTELQASRMMYSRTASRLSYVESQLKETCKARKSMELARCVPISSELSIMSIDNGSDDGISSSGSWANALISELEHFKDGKIKNQLERKASDMSLMDDFVEMEKLAIVSMEAPSSRGTSRALIPVLPIDSNLAETKREIYSKDVATENSFDWLQVVLNAMLKQRQISKQSLDELLEDIRIALGYVNYPTVTAADSVAISNHRRISEHLYIESYTTLKPSNRSPVAHSSDENCRIDKEISSQHLESNLSKSIYNIIELIEGVNITSSGSYPYSVHVFQWKPSELSAVLQKFVGACNDQLSGKADLHKFVGELSYALDWIMNNCIAPKDASSARNKIKKHFGWNESPSGNKVGVEVDGLLGESNTVDITEEQSSCLFSAAPVPDENILIPKECIGGNLHEENRRLKDEMKNMEARLKSVTDKSKELIIQLSESKEHIGSLETEVKTLKESNEIIEDQIENQKSINEDLDTQLTVTKAKLNEVFQKFSSLEVELEYKNNCCEELEATCLELQLQLESVARKETPNHGINQEGKRSQNGWEMTAASLKLAECQETILNLGKQLKALASPREAALFDKVFSTTNPATTTANNKKLNKRFSLRDQMLAEDSTKEDLVKPPNNKATSSIEDAQKPSLHSNDCNDLNVPNIPVHTPEAYIASNNKTSSTALGSLAIVPAKKRGVGFLMKLLLRRKKGTGKNSRSLAKV
ncbi:Filament-like plant protein [Melia azedarach]|uniref:Filament-like plant protein n=1 Tax=Melia azedarach TaxID=155640 RepID=A0ACC1XXX9_MELAZ|nr:Filament-like plant protein [Melia azedarach]